MVNRRFDFSKKAIHGIGLAVIIDVVLSTGFGMFTFVRFKASFTDWAVHTYRRFTQLQSSPSDASRLFTLSSSGRWQLWDESIEILSE